jgi:predicted aspartyl protease
MMRPGNRFEAISIWMLGVCAALVSPRAAQAAPEANPAPPITFHFDLKLDASRIAPQPLIEPDKGLYLVAEVELNGHRLPALLDTGAEFTLVDSSMAKEIGLKVEAPFETNAIGGKTQIGRADIDKLVIGPFTRSGGWIGVGDLTPIRAYARQPAAMIIGADLLAHIAFGVSHDKGTIIFLPTGVHLSGTYAAVQLRISQPGNHVLMELGANGHPVTVAVDTGSDDELVLAQPKWAEIIPASARTTTRAGWGLGGVISDTISRIQQVKLGNESADDVIAVRTSAVPGADVDGVVGMGLLSRWDVFMDAQAGVMALTKPSKAAPPRRETMVGIQGPPTDAGIQVFHVMANSPAEAAGLKTGDRICTVDGQAVKAAWEGTPKNDWMLGPEGKTVVLGRCGGGEVKVTLRRFY